MKKRREKQQSNPEFLNSDGPMHKYLEENPEAKDALIRQISKVSKVKRR